MLKILFLIHRYFGIGLGLIMLLWCLSGFVMMYKPYPELSIEQQLAALPDLNLNACCTIALDDEFASARYNSFRVQMLDREPVLFLEAASGELTTVNLASGTLFKRLTSNEITASAIAYAGREGHGQAQLLGEINNDQWTVYGAYNPHRPLYHYSAGDAAGSQWYVSSRTGEVIQATTREQRIWGYLGAVVHWLYPTLLRENVLLWSQTVIWLTIIGIFLTATGLYFGIRQYKVRKNGRKSPYRGLSRWHHYTGLFFGVLTLSWVFSGLFSMNPWGWLEGEGPAMEANQLRNGSFSWPEIAATLPRLNSLPVSADTVAIEGRMLLGRPGLYTLDREGERQRFDPQTFKPADLEHHDWEEIALQLSGGKAPLSAGLIDSEDSYYYHHHIQVRLPAFRVIADNPGQVRYYLNPENGAILQKTDGEKQWYRWVFYGLHRGDFTVFLRSRPVWDIFMWTLLLGVTAVCTTGFLMGLRRLSSNRRTVHKHNSSVRKKTVLSGRKALIKPATCKVFGEEQSA